MFLYRFELQKSGSQFKKFDLPFSNHHFLWLLRCVMLLKSGDSFVNQQFTVVLWYFFVSRCIFLFVGAMNRLACQNIVSQNSSKLSLYIFPLELLISEVFWYFLSCLNWAKSRITIPLKINQFHQQQTIFMNMYYSSSKNSTNILCPDVACSCFSLVFNYSAFQTWLLWNSWALRCMSPNVNF